MQLKLLLKTCLKTSIILPVLIGFSSCADLKKVDVPVCKELLPSAGYCSWTISKKSMIIDDKNLLYGKTWWQNRLYNLSIPPESWAPIKAEFTKVCAKHQNDCRASGADESIQRMDELINATAEKLLLEKQ